MFVPFACRKGDRDGGSTCKKATDDDFLTGKKDNWEWWVGWQRAGPVNCYLEENRSERCVRLTIVGHDESWSNRRYSKRKSRTNNEWQNMCVHGCVCVCVFSKQKIVTRSSTEAELVGISDALSQILWTREYLSYLWWNRQQCIRTISAPSFTQAKDDLRVREVVISRSDISLFHIILRVKKSLWSICQRRRWLQMYSPSHYMEQCSLYLRQLSQGIFDNCPLSNSDRLRQLI